jgi:hypothetical protein
MIDLLSSLAPLHVGGFDDFLKLLLGLLKLFK